MNIQTPAGPTVAQSYMSALKACGIRHVFANGGTDFAPIIEGILQNWQAGGDMPEFVTVPHENVAVAMAQGYYKASGDMAGVMVHVNVGTANTICALMNAARDNTPILLAAGRTPLTETGHAGSRDVPIHWAQENFDQAAIVREHVKWEYELRDGQPVNTLVARAVDIAMSEPKGPVYLTLPREVLGNPSTNPGPAPRGRAFGAVPAIPDIEALERAADMIAAAQNPVIVMTSAANAATFKALGAFAKAHAIAVLTGPHAALSSSNPDEPGPGERTRAQGRRPHPGAEFGRAVGAAHRPAEQGRAAHPHRHRPAFRDLSLPRLRDGPRHRRRSGGGAHDAGRHAPHEAEGQGGGDRPPPQAQRRKAPGAARQPQGRHRGRLHPEPHQLRLGRPLRERGQGRQRHGGRGAGRALRLPRRGGPSRLHGHVLGGAGHGRLAWVWAPSAPLPTAR